MVLALAHPTFVEIDLNEVRDTGNCNDEVQTIEYKSCSKRHISIASEYDYKQLPKAQNSICGLQFWQSVLPLKQVREYVPMNLQQDTCIQPIIGHSGSDSRQRLVDFTEDTLCMVLPYWMAVSTVYVAERWCSERTVTDMHWAHLPLLYTVPSHLC